MSFVNFSADASKPSCPLCGEARVEGHLWAHTDFPASRIYRCGACQHAYCFPEPDLQELTSHYDGKYAASRLMYLGPLYRRVMRRRARAQADLILRYAKGTMCVDIGCGIGALVARMAQLGWNSSGFDGDAEVVKYGASSFAAKVTIGSLGEFLAANEEVDLVCMSHVLEHLSDLQSTLRRIVGKLRSGGYVFVEVPNDIDPPRRDMESHLHFFSRRSLSSALTCAGLEVLACNCCGPLTQTVQLPPRSVFGRVAARIRRSFGHTEWDGWYDRYHDGDAGIWIRCVARKVA